MRTQTQRDSRREGAALGLVLTIVVAVSLVGVSLAALGRADAVETARVMGKAKAFWAAEAGLESVKALASRYKLPMDIVGIHGATTHDGTVPGASYSCQVADDGAWSNAGNIVKKYVFTCLGTSAGGETYTVAVDAEIETFAAYVHASNSEETPSGANIYWVTGDILDGRVYVNDQMNIWNRPRVLDLARTSAGSVNYQGTGDSTVFEGGLQLNMPELDFLGEGEDHIHSIRDQAAVGGVMLSGNHAIEFHDDGRITYWPLGSPGSKTTNDLADINGAIYVDGRCVIGGVVDGRVTIASESEIRIFNTGIVYESARSPDPHDDPDTFNPANVDDALGLVARRHVQVMGSNDIKVHAAVLVTEDNPGGYADDEWGFHADQKYVDNRGWRDGVFRPPYIELYGGLAQERRGIVGRTNGQGFLKRYTFDIRFLDDAPPHYPYSQYLISNWRETP